MTPSSLLDIVPVIPVVVVHDAADAVPIAQALVDGGLPMIELTLRTPAGLEAIKKLTRVVVEHRSFDACEKVTSPHKTLSAFPAISKGIRGQS